MGDFWESFKMECSGVATSCMAFSDATVEDVVFAACFPEERDASWEESLDLNAAQKRL